MRCFMRANDGYRPKELASLRKRGLEQFRLNWKKFYEQALSSRIHSLSDEQIHLLRDYAALMIAEVDGFLKYGKGRFEVSSTTKNMLAEIESIESVKVKETIKKVRSFHTTLRKNT